MQVILRVQLHETWSNVGGIGPDNFENNFAVSLSSICCGTSYSTSSFGSLSKHAYVNADLEAFFQMTPKEDVPEKQASAARYACRTQAVGLCSSLEEPFQPAFLAD